MRQYRFIIRTFLVFRLLAGAQNSTWGATVTYHILTLPINPSRYDYHLNSVFEGKRLEAVRVVDNNAITVDLPAAYKSPLATNFKYYASSNVTKSSTAENMYQYSAKNKSFFYTITSEGEGDNIGGNDVTSNMDVYVTYQYDDSKGIKLDGSENYNIPISGGFLAFNRGRNNRLAVIPESANRVSAEDLVSEDFVKVDVSNIPGTSIASYWNGNPTPKMQLPDNSTSYSSLRVPILTTLLSVLLIIRIIHIEKNMAARIIFAINGTKAVICTDPPLIIISSWRVTTTSDILNRVTHMSLTQCLI